MNIFPLHVKVFFLHVNPTLSIEGSVILHSELRFRENFIYFSFNDHYSIYIAIKNITVGKVSKNTELFLVRIFL